MIKPGDRVYIWNRIDMTGEVLSLKAKPVKTWFIGGTSGTSTSAIVRFDNGETLEIAASELMRLE